MNSRTDEQFVADLLAKQPEHIKRLYTKGLTADEIIARMHLYSRTGVITVEGDTDGELQDRIRKYIVRHDISGWDELGQSIFFPADSRDRKRRRDVVAIYRRWVGEAS